MCTKIHFISVVMTTLLLLFTSGSVPAQDQKPAGQQRNLTKLELAISKDGRSIVDQDGKTIARFVKGTRVQTPIKGASAKLQGCMRCRTECVIYEGERCVRSIRTCEWDFDCK